MRIIHPAMVLIASLFISSCGTQRPVMQNNESSVPYPAFDKQGHRGSRGLMPENTIPAMLKAIDLGVTTLEMDVVISRDKQVVVSHDPYFNSEITTTPEGGQLTKKEGTNRLLYSMDYDSIRKYDVGLKPHPGFPRQQKIAVYKPQLYELIRASEAYAREKGVDPLWYNIETKSNPSGDGTKHPAPEEFVDLLAGVIQKEGIAQRTVIQSFDPRTLQVVNRKYPGIKTSYLIEATDLKSLDGHLKALGFTPFALSPHFTLVTPQLVRACHDKGMKVVPWTLNTKDQMDAAKAAGVDGIITDYPDLFNEK